METELFVFRPHLCLALAALASPAVSTIESHIRVARPASFSAHLLPNHGVSKERTRMSRLIFVALDQRG
jgi:hypothetical protein